jgi:uridine kinase
MLLQVMLPAYVRLRHLAKNAWVFLLDAQVSLMPTFLLIF